MAKTIKFNLLLDDNPVRDIKGLQNNFCIDDILEVYQNGLLQKWLKVRGFDEYLEKVENIKKDSSVIVELIKIFDIQKDDAEIREGIYSLEFQENRKKSLKDFAAKDTKLKNRIKEYHKEYEELIEAIIENKENMAFLKEASKEISDKYLKLFELDYKDSYELYKEKSPFMIYAILMNDKLSFLFMKNNIIKKDLNKNFIGGRIRKDYFFKFKGKTNSYWKDLETVDTKVMILSIPTNTFIRSAKDLKQELSAKDVNGNFLILDGLAYKSNINTKSIVYMKV